MPSPVTLNSAVAVNAPPSLAMNKGGRTRPAPLALSSSPPTLSPMSNSPVVFGDQPLSDIIGDTYDDDTELALLESLRNSVQQNLALRPLTKPQQQQQQQQAQQQQPPRFPFRQALQLASPISNPTDDGYIPFDISDYAQPSPPSSPGARSDSLNSMPSLSSSASTSASECDPAPGIPPFGPFPMTPDTLFQVLSTPSAGFPLLLDTRPVGPFLASRLRHSINLAIPSLILKRCRKPSPSPTTFAFNDIHALKAFVTTERGKEEWDSLVSSSSSRSFDEDDHGFHSDGQTTGSVLAPNSHLLLHGTATATSAYSPQRRPLADAAPTAPIWNGDIVVYDDEMDERDHLAPSQSQTKQATTPGAPSSTAWTLLSVLSPMRANDTGRVFYLKGGMMAARAHPSSQFYFVENHGQGDVERECGGESPRIRAVLPSSTSSPTATSLNSPLPVQTSAANSAAVRSNTGNNHNTAGSSRSVGISPAGRASSVVGHGVVKGPTITAFDRKTTGGGVSSGGGLFSLRTDVAARSKPMPELDLSSSNSSPSSSHSGNQSQSQLLPPPRSPRPLTLAPVPSILDSSPSPSPSSLTANLAFPRSPIRSRSNSAMLPKLTKLDTRSKERLAPPALSINTDPAAVQQHNGPPKLFLRTQPLKAATLAAPIASPLVSDFGVHGAGIPPSPGRRGFYAAQSPISPQSGMSQFYTPVQTPSDLPLYYPQSTVQLHPSHHLQAPTTPLTARPPPTPTTLESAAIPEFTISTILPNFLYLGPEITTESQAAELEALGVKRIINIAAECDDDYGLGLRQRFEKYVKIPMRDIVEEENVGRAARDVCEILDDARLHSAPAYVHCKAGKSRSVTMVIAYLIHANHWPLSRAYTFVLDRRRGIAPNIGFVSELMNFEEQELGRKSVGVVKDEDDHGGGGGASKTGNYAHLAGGRRAAHTRESLPPVFQHSQTNTDIVGLSSLGSQSAGGPMATNAMEEMEVKDAEGRYRHARRAPVDEQTLQPLRRVSKAGLETSWI